MPHVHYVNNAAACYTQALKPIGVPTDPKAFVGALGGAGVGAFCFTGGGRIDGKPEMQYFVNNNGYTEMVSRTFDAYF